MSSFGIALLQVVVLIAGTIGVCVFARRGAIRKHHAALLALKSQTSRPHIPSELPAKKAVERVHPAPHVAAHHDTQRPIETSPTTSSAQPAAVLQAPPPPVAKGDASEDIDPDALLEEALAAEDESEKLLDQLLGGERSETMQSIDAPNPGRSSVGGSAAAAAATPSAQTSSRDAEVEPEDLVDQALNEIDEDESLLDACLEQVSEDVVQHGASETTPQASQTTGASGRSSVDEKDKHVESRMPSPGLLTASPRPTPDLARAQALYRTGNELRVLHEPGSAAEAYFAAYRLVGNNLQLCNLLRDAIEDVYTEAGERDRFGEEVLPELRRHQSPP